MRKHSFVIIFVITYLTLSVSSIQAGTITVTNLNTTYTTNGNSGVEVGLEQTLQFTGTGFTEYANQEIALNVFLENQSAWWDKTDNQWEFPVLLKVDAGGNFQHNWTLPYVSTVYPGVTIGAGQYVVAGNMRVAIANKSILGGLLWVKRNDTGNAQAIWGYNDKIYVGYAGGIVAAFNKSYVGTSYYGLGDTNHHGYIWRTALSPTTQVEEVWSDGNFVYTVQSTTTNGLKKLNATNGAQVLQASNPANAYAIFGYGDYLYVTYAANTAPRKYNKTLSQNTTFDPVAYAAIGYDVWVDADRVYVCYADGYVYAYNSTTGATLWSKQGVAQQCNGIFGDDNAVYSGHNLGFLIKYNKTNGDIIWNITDYAHWNILNIWVNANYVYALYSDGRVVYFSKTDGTSGLFRHFAYYIPGSAQQGNSIYGDDNYIYTAHNSGWIFKYGQETKNLEWHPEANFWIRDLADTWNVIIKPTKPVFSDNETLAFEFMVFDNKTNPVNVNIDNLQGTYFYLRTLRAYNQWEATSVNEYTLDPRISTGWISRWYWIYANNLTFSDCPSTHYDYGPYYYSNRTGWIVSGQWCLYHNTTVPPPVYTTYNATKLPTYELATILPKQIINGTDATWFSILKGYTNNPYENLTKYYGNDKYTWFAVFGSNPTTYTLDSGVLGIVKKAGGNYEYAWADKFGRSDIWKVSRSGTTDSRYMYARYSLAQNTTPFEFYWILSDTQATNTSNYITQGIEKSTIAIANSINISVGDDEYKTAGWSVDGNLFYHRRNISFTEPNVIERIDEPVNFTFDPFGNINSDCRDIRVVDDASNLVVFQNETCSANSVNLWLFINLTKGQQRNFSVYYNSTASTPSFTLMDVTTSGTCPTQTINLRRMNLAYDTNYTKSYNWTAWGVGSGEYLQFNFGNTSSWATNTQSHYWSFNNGTAPSSSVGGWNQRCLIQRGAIFTKISVNQTAIPVAAGVDLDVFGTVYVFQKSGRVKIIIQPSRTVIDTKDNYPAYYRYGFDTVSPQNKAGNERYHIWTDWAGRREMLDKTVLGEPLINYTYYNVNGVQTPLKGTFRFPFPPSFAFNYNASQPACMGNQLMDYFIYRVTPTPAGTSLATIAEFLAHDFGICHRSLYNNITQYNTGWTILYPDIRLFGTTYNKWVDAATYAKFFLLQNNYTPFSRVHYFYPYAASSYTSARATLASVDMCPDVEHNYNSYTEMLNNVSKNTIDDERKTSGNYDCLVNLVKLIDQRGADKTEFILTKNSTIYYGEIRRTDEPYPTVITEAGYRQTTANKASYWYGNWFSIVTPHPYVLHGYSTSGNPQFIPATSVYYEAPHQYFNKYVWDESYFWDKNKTNLLAGTGVNIGPETSDARGFTCNLASVSGAAWESTARKGWTHVGTAAVACPYSLENMKHYAYARPSYTSYISTTTGGSTGTYYDFYIFGRNDQSQSMQVGTHNSLFDYKHYPDGTSTDINDINGLNNSEYHMNKQPWFCIESSRNNRVFCEAYTSTSSFVYSAATGAANEQYVFGQDYSSAVEINRFFFYSNTRWGGGTYYPTDFSTYRYVYPYLASGEVDVNLLYAGEGSSENILMVFPDAWIPLIQGYPQGFDLDNRFWIYFDQDSRQYTPGQTLTINGTLFKNNARLSGAAVLLTILKSDATFITNAVKVTDEYGRFNWTYTLPTTLTSGLYYVKADYNNGEIVNKFGFKVTTNVVTISTNKPSYAKGETLTTTFTVKDYLTNAYKDPDRVELRYYSPDGSIIRCAKYPSTANIQNCPYNLTRTATGYYSDSFTLSESAQLGIYLQKVTTTDTGITANFYNTFSVSEFTGWIDVSINNTIVGTSFTSNVTTRNTGDTQVTKTVEVTVPTACGYINSVTNATGQAITYNIQDLGSACKVYWDVTLAGSATTWFKIQSTLQAGGGGAYPGIEVDAPSVINTSIAFGINAFVRNTDGQLTNCDSNPLLTLRDNMNGSIILSGVQMTNYATGQYNYTTSLPYQSIFLVQVNCSIGSTIFISNPKIISSQNVPGMGGVIDYNQTAFYVWNYTNRTLTDYNQSEILNYLYNINTTQTVYFQNWNATFYFWNNTYFVNWNGNIMNLTNNWDKLWNYWKCDENNNMVCNLLWDLKNTTPSPSSGGGGGGGSVVYQVYMESKGGIVENITGVEFVYDNYFETSPDSYYPLPITIKNNYNYTVSVKFYKVTDNVYFSPEYPIYINPNSTARVVLYLPIHQEGDFTYQIGAKTIYLANEENKTLTFYGKVNKFISLRNFIQKYYLILAFLSITLVVVMAYKYLVGKGG